VLREALSDLARHAAATAAHVDVAVAAGRLTLTVTDDGRGPGEAERRSGLANMRRRAEEHGGEFSLGAAEPRGTRLRWSVPIG
jgi:signal transduction histidine kinase